MRFPSQNSDFFKNGLPYSNSFKAHTGCVNAVTYSKTNGGRIMASGGDCTTIHIWDLYREFDDAAPIHAFNGPTKNIFGLEFNSTDDTLYCGSNDSVIYKYDLKHDAVDIFSTSTPSYKDKLDFIPKHPPDVRQISHGSSISQISAHPAHRSLILSASSDDEIQLTDERIEKSTNIGTFHTESEWRDVKWHPLSEHLFACCDSHGGVYLNDIRKGFEGFNMSDGSFGTSMNPFVHNMAVMQYNATLTSKDTSKRIRLDSSSISFNNTGDLFGVIYQHSYPTIYSIKEVNPLAILTGDYTPEGVKVQPNGRTYSTTCTTKHCSFEGNYFATGSDDFRGYVWKIPPASRLMEGRKEVSHENLDEGFKSGYFGEYRSAFSSSRDEDICLPTVVNRPAFRLEGHSSIVNSAMIHPTLPLVATSGVEKIVKLHTPTPFTNELEVSKTPPSRQMGDETRNSRRDFLMALLTSPYEHEATNVEEDPLTINFFDSLLRRDQEVDIWNEPDSNEDEDLDDMAELMMGFGRGEFEEDEEDEVDDEDIDEDDMSVDVVGASEDSESEESIDIDEAYPV